MRSRKDGRLIVTDASGTKVFAERREGQVNVVIYKPSGGQMALRVELKPRDLDALIAELQKMRNEQ